MVACAMFVHSIRFHTIFYFLINIFLMNHIFKRSAKKSHFLQKHAHTKTYACTQNKIKYIKKRNIYFSHHSIEMWHLTCLPQATHIRAPTYRSPSFRISFLRTEKSLLICCIHFFFQELCLFLPLSTSSSSSSYHTRSAKNQTSKTKRQLNEVNIYK